LRVLRTFSAFYLKEQKSFLVCVSGKRGSHTSLEKIKFSFKRENGNGKWGEGGKLE
jgi:hypothetical protein